jgi:hypothetical protein
MSGRKTADGDSGTAAGALTQLPVDPAFPGETATLPPIAGWLERLLLVPVAWSHTSERTAPGALTMGARSVVAATTAGPVRATNRAAPRARASGPQPRLISTVGSTLGLGRRLLEFRESLTLYRRRPATLIAAVLVSIVFYVALNLKPEKIESRHHGERQVDSLLAEEGAPLNRTQDDCQGTNRQAEGR